MEFLFDLFSCSYSIDRCNDSLQDTLESFVDISRQDNISYDKFLKVTQGLPKLSDIVKTNISFSTYHSTSHFYAEIRHRDIHMPKLHVKQWRNLSGETFFDMNVGAVYGAWQLIWMHIISNRQDFEAAVDLNLFITSKEKPLTYDDWSAFTDYYKGMKYIRLSATMYNFAKGLNCEYYFRCKLENISSTERTFGSQTSASPKKKHPEGLSLQNANYRRKRAQRIISELMSVDRAIQPCSILELVNKNNIYCNQPNWQDFGDPANYFQAAVMLSEKNHPEAIQKIRRFGDHILKSGNSSDIDYVTDVLNTPHGILEASVLYK